VILQSFANYFFIKHVLQNIASLQGVPYWLAARILTFHGMQNDVLLFTA
jgi:hypothetical protein